ncbi:MAG: hypothetical protein ISR65_04895 [Bacteriovoracaceae bacterium]|nr:hypothetical protein [Bacteriovoracaceae bacterium]
MLPDEIQAAVAKVLFFIFAVCVLCLTKVQANETCYTYKPSTMKVVSKTTHPAAF